MSNEKNTVLKKPYQHKSKLEWDEFKGDLCAVLALQKNKLDTVMTTGHLHRAVVRRETKDSGLLGSAHNNYSSGALGAALRA